MLGLTWQLGQPSRELSWERIVPKSLVLGKLAECPESCKGKKVDLQFSKQKEATKD